MTHENEIREDESSWWIRTVTNPIHDLRALRQIAENYPISKCLSDDVLLRERDTLKARLAAAEARAEKAERLWREAWPYLRGGKQPDMGLSYTLDEVCADIVSEEEPAPTPPAPARCEARTPEASAHRPLYPTPPAPASGERCPTCGGRAIFTERPCGKAEWDEYHNGAGCRDAHHPWNHTPPREGGKGE